MPIYIASGLGAGDGGSAVNQTITANIYADADMEIVANGGNGLLLRFGEPAAEPMVPAVLAAAVTSVDTDLDNGDIPGATVRWNVPMQVSSNPAHHGSDSLAFYRTDQHRLRYSEGANYVNAADIPEGENFFDPDITWANIGETNAEIFADGTGRFDTNADVLVYLEANHDVFQARFDAGRTRIAYYSTVRFRVDVADITTIGSPLTPAGSPYAANGEAGNDWTLQGRKRDVGEAATGATWRLITVANGTQGIEVTLTNPLGTAGNAYNTSYIVGDANPNRVTQSGTQLLFYPGSNWLASAILTAINGLANYSAAYYGAEDGTSEPFDDLTTGQLFPSGFPNFAGGVEPVSGTPPDVVVDEAAETITVNYAPAAEGSVAGPDTLGVLKALLDVDGIRGVFSEYQGTGAAADEFTRATPWDEPFGGGSVFSVDATGWGPGPSQNVFTGADEAAALVVLQAYSAANDAWRAVYLSDQRLTVALRWGSDGDGTTYYLDTDGVWKDLGLVWLRGEDGSTGREGGIGPAGPVSDLVFDTTIAGAGTTADPRRVAIPVTQPELDKLADVEADATADQTGAEIVGLLDALTGNGRLDATVALRLIAAALDIELGQDDWRLGGVAGSRDTAAQILVKLLTVDGAGSGLDADLLDGMTPAEVAALSGSSDTAAQVLAKLLTVDGAGSGLDADVLDAMTPTQVASLAYEHALPTYIATAGTTWDAVNHTINATVNGVTALENTDELILLVPSSLPGQGPEDASLSVNGEQRLLLRPVDSGFGRVASQELIPGSILLLFKTSVGYRLLEPHILERAGVWASNRIYLRGQDVLRGDYDYKLLAETSTNERPEDHPEIWYRFPHLESQLSPLSGVQTFTEDDFKSVVNVDGDLVEVVRQHHDGHGQTYTTLELTDATFLGFVARVSEVASPADGQFIFNQADGFIGGFEQYRTSGTTGWYNYDPFASGEPWENAPAAATYSGALTYAGNTRNARDLDNLASAAGQVFALTEADQVVLIDTYSVTGGYDEYVPRQIVPAYFNNPRAYFWLKDQTERSPDGTTFPAVLTAGGDGEAVLEFVGANPDLAYDDGDVVYAGGTALASTFRRLLHPPRGRHDFHIVLESNYATAGLLTFSFYKDVGMSDERYLGQVKVVTDEAAVHNVTITARFTVPDVVTDGSENYYIRIDGVTPTETINLRGYVLIEYKGDE